MPLKLSEEKPKIAEFLNNHHVGIIATANSEGRPHAATIFFTVDSNLNVYFVTKEQTTKSQNLHDNPRASLAVFEAPKLTTVQIHGTVSEIEDKPRYDEILIRIYKIAAASSQTGDLPIAELSAGKFVAYELKPAVIRLAEYSTADHGVVDEIFDVATAPDAEL